MGNTLSNSLIHQEPLETRDFTSYEAACELDEDVRNFDSNLKERTGKVLNAVATDASQQTFSFNSLKEVTTSLLDMDREVMEVILEYKADVWKDGELFLLVEEFFKNSLATLEFCTATESCIKNAKDNLSFLKIALKLVPEDRAPDEGEVQSVLSALHKFCQKENPFGASFVQKFEAVREGHTSMLLKLKEKKRILDKKLKNLQVWRKVSAILFGAAVAAILICSVVAAAIAAPPIAGALAAASGLLSGSVGTWVQSMWKGYENGIRAQLDVVEKMHVRTAVAIQDLNTIKSLASRLQIDLEAIVTNIQFINKHGDVCALRLAVENIELKRSSFVEELEDMQRHVERVGNRIQQARTIVLRTISVHPN